METTAVSAIKTAAELSSLLVQAGARQIMCSYDGGTPVGLAFQLPVSGVVVAFALPVRVDPISRLLLKRRKGYVNDTDKIRIREQAERVAWRQLLRWVQAQLAFIQTGMVKTEEIFLPYALQSGTDRTLFQFFESDGVKLLAAPADKPTREGE